MTTTSSRSSLNLTRAMTNGHSPFSSKNIQECRCGSNNCRGVLGPRPKEREIKDALKPLTESAGTKRKLQQAMGDIVEAVSSKKRKIAVPKSVKKAVQTVSAQAKAQLAKVNAIKSGEENERLVKKVSERSLRHLKRAKGKSTTVKFRARTIKGSAASAEPVKRSARGSTIRVNSKSVKRNVVSTIKGANRRGGVGKSIRVIEGE